MVQRSGSLLGLVQELRVDDIFSEALGPIPDLDDLADVRLVKQ